MSNKYHFWLTICLLCFLLGLLGGCVGMTSQLKLTPPSEITLPTVRNTESFNVPKPQKVTPVITNTIYVTPPMGEFLLLWYPPLRMRYDPSAWIDESNYIDTYILVNYLQSRVLETCKISVSGPTEFNYPYESNISSLGKVQYETKKAEDIPTRSITMFYIAFGFLDNYDYNQALPLLAVSASQSEFNECKSLAEQVLSTLYVP